MLFERYINFDLATFEATYIDRNTVSNNVAICTKIVAAFCLKYSWWNFHLWVNASNKNVSNFIKMSNFSPLNVKISIIHTNKLAVPMPKNAFQQIGHSR